MLNDPVFVAAVAAAVLIAGISKGGFGGGLGVMAVPLMTLVMPPVQAAAIMLPILCSMDLMNLRSYWRKWDMRELKALVPASIVGIAVGVALFRYMSNDMLRLLIGLIAVLFTLNHWFGRRPPVEGLPHNPVKAGFWGAITGFTSFAAHAGGPPINMYLLPRRLPRTVYQATTVAFFTSVNYVKLVPYWWLGLFPESNLTVSLAMLPVAAAGIASGVWLHNRVPDAIFYRLAYVFLFITGMKLLTDGIRGLI